MARVSVFFFFLREMGWGWGLEEINLVFYY